MHVLEIIILGSYNLFLRSLIPTSICTIGLPGQYLSLPCTGLSKPAPLSAPIP